MNALPLTGILELYCFSPELCDFGYVVPLQDTLKQSNILFSILPIFTPRPMP
jgi:hypothetical protein